MGLNLLQPNLRFALAGTFRALAKPDGNGWLVNRPYDFVFDPVLPAIAPISFNSRTQLADLALLRVFAQAGGRLGPSFNGSSFNLIADGLALEFFQSGEFINTSSSIQADGTFSFAATLPGAGVQAGIVRLKPTSSSQATASVAVNPLQATFTAVFPACFINPANNDTLWPKDRFETKAFAVDSENFSLRLRIPDLSFAQIPLVKTTEADEDNYFEFKRRGSATQIKLRNHQDLFLGGLELDISVNSNGAVSGHLAGRLGLPGPTPLDVVSDRVSIDYHSSPAPEFLLNRYFLGAGCRLKLGSNLLFGGSACLLDPLSTKPLAERSEIICLP